MEQTEANSSKPRFTLTQLRRMTVPQLKIHLGELGLDTEGKKEVFHERLRSILYPPETLSNTLQDGGGHNLEFQKYGRMLKRIPKGSRLKAAKAFTLILDKVIIKNDIHYTNLISTQLDFCFFIFKD